MRIDAALWALGGVAENPLDHVRQHSILTVEADWGLLTPAGEITVLSDIIVTMLVAALLLALALPPLVRRRRGAGEVDRLVPTGSANFLEMICEYLRREVAEPALQEHTDRFVKFLWTVFFFILTLNLLGLLPIAAVSPLFGVHVGGTATGNLWVTGTLALVTFAMMVINGLRLGGRHYLAHFNPGPPWLAILMVPVEIFGTLTKVFALAIRLFANMTAGHVLLAVLLSFIFTAGGAAWWMGGLIAVPVVLGSVAITMLEIFVAFLQAFIFTFLTALFIGQSVVFHHDAEEHLPTGH
jgi:F-type H+-transporting ATPase subunit a